MCLYIENKEVGFLSRYISNPNKNPCWTLTDKMIIAYGTACAMEYLHYHQIILRFLSPQTIILDSHLNPFIIEFGIIRNLDDEDNINDSLTLYHLPFEFLENPEACKNSFKIDVYSFGMLLYEIITENELKSQYINVYQILDGERPEFPDSTLPNWRDLIKNCWSQDPDERPTFSEICDLFESAFFINSSINRFVFGKYMDLVRPFRPGSK